MKQNDLPPDSCPIIFYEKFFVNFFLIIF